MKNYIHPAFSWFFVQKIDIARMVPLHSFKEKTE